MELFRTPQVLVMHLKRVKSIWYILKELGTPVESSRVGGLPLTP